MRVIGFNFNKISINKQKEAVEGLKINTNIEIKKIQKRTIELFKEEKVLAFDYEFKLDYQPEIANILFSGSLLILFDDEKLVKEIEKNWKKEEIIDDIKIPLLNIIFSKCNLKALQLEEDLGLPPHIPSPRIGKSQQKKE